MRTKLGLAVATMTAASVLAFGAPAATAQTTPDEPVEQDAPASSDETTTTETTTTTTVPVIDGPVILRPNGSTPEYPTRGTSVNINPPPPSTTTTTLPPGPDFRLPANSGTGRRVVYSKSLQKVWVVEADGRLVKEHRVSGKLQWCDPKPGTYQVFSRSRYTFALQNPSIIWGYMIRFTRGCNGGNIGFHEIPINKYTGRAVQSVSQLGTPLSGGCVRQALSDAIWMWNWAYVGTKVVVLP